MNKTELVIFRSPKNKFTKIYIFDLVGKKIEPEHHTKYLWVILDEHLSFNEYMNTLKQKFNGANGILAKLIHCISADILKTIYYALFDSHMRYACQIWGQSHSKTFDMIQTTQNKALRIINFK